MHKTLNFIIITSIIISLNESRILKRSTHQFRICSLLDPNEYGECRKLSDCLPARQALNLNEVPPRYCEYDLRDPIVCCPLINNDKKTHQLSRRVSVEKCSKTYSVTELRRKKRNSPEENNGEDENETEEVGGIPTERGEFEYMAAIGWIGDETEHFCGGTLISEDFVLTAAHCTSIRGIAPNFVKIGGDGLEESLHITTIDKIYVHPEYKRKENYHDIALLKLKNFVSNKPACLWQSNDLEHEKAISIGYGHTAFAGKGSNELLKIEINIYTNENCSTYYTPEKGYRGKIIQSQICAGDPTMKMDSCQGDSGGPLLVKTNKNGLIIPYILGITSFGQGCAIGVPSVYVRVSSYLDWIESIVWPHNYNYKEEENNFKVSK